MEETTHYHETHEYHNDGVNHIIKLYKNLKNDDNIESFKIKSDDRFVLRCGKKLKTVSEETTLMNERAHSHVYIMTYSIEEAKLILNLSRSHQQLVTAQIWQLLIMIK